MEVTRRHLLPAVLEELFVAMGESRGVRGYRLADLADAPDDVLRRVVPVRVPDRHVFLDGGHVCSEGGGGRVTLFPADQVHLDAFNACDGSRDLACIASVIRERWEVGEDEAFALARGLFLRLLAADVLVPANPAGRP
jgi:hypothetical protein